MLSHLPMALTMKDGKPESSLQANLEPAADYAGYLRLGQLLDAQRPLSDPVHHDEVLFIVQHQVTELWMKLSIHEIVAATRCIRNDDIPAALRHLARVGRIQEQMNSQWAVLDTLTPADYLQFRDALGEASGFQSPQFRLLDFLLGNKNGKLLSAFRSSEHWYARLRDTLHAPGVFDEFLMYLARSGRPVPDAAVDRDFSVPRRTDPGVVAVLRRIYEAPRENWQCYEMCETLMDISNNFQLWRFRHMKTVERIIGHKKGSGGSSGVAMLRKTLDIEIFPELIRARTELGGE